MWYYIIKDKLWSEASPEEQNKLLQLLTAFAIVFVVFCFYLIFNAITNFYVGSFLSNFGVLLFALLGLFYTIKGNPETALNTIYALPILIYAFYISDFNTHPSLIDTILLTTWWLLAGLLMLLIFSKINIKIFIYYIISLATIVFQLQKANQLLLSFSIFQPLVTHPLVLFTGVFIGSYFIRYHFKTTADSYSNILNQTKQNITKILRESELSIVQLRAERDLDGNIVELKIKKVNPAFESNFKINLHEVQDQEAGYIFSLIFRNNFDVNQTLFISHKRTKEFYAQNLDRWFKVHILKPEYNKFYLMFEETTKIKQRIALLEASKKRYKVLLEAIPDIFFVIDKYGTYEDFVIKESDLFKVEDANIIGSTIYDVGFPDNMANKIKECIQSSIKNNSIESIEYSLNTPNGTFLFEMRLAKLNSKSVISVARDITKRKTAEFNLEKALIRAEESDNLKSRFLANLSHEVRTPLNIITNFTQMLAESELESTEKIELSEAVSQNGKQLLNMIENTIHLSKIETDTVETKTDFCKVNHIIRDLYNHYLPLIPNSKEIKLHLKLDVPNPEFGFKSDARLLAETLAILLDNAVKYTLDGQITFGYEMIKNQAVKFIIFDTGIGMEKDEFQNIFSRFYRIENNINETTSGSGLGLPIAKYYVNTLGGKLEFESTPNQGTKFWFSLPFKEGQGFLRVVS